MTKARYPWMALYCCAITESDGEITFNQVTTDNIEVLGTSSIISKKHSVNPPPEFYDGLIREITVPSSRMDTLLKKENVEGTIDVVKVDTEGYTWQVLQGFGDRLKDVKLFHLETEKTSTTPEHMTSDKVAEFMSAQGFVLVDTSHEWGEIIQDQIWVNPALATRNKECFI